MLVRGALRLAADVPSTAPTHDLPQLARFLHRTLLARNASNTPAVRALSRAYRTALSDYRRSYATTTKATKPTATVKKAVKAKAAGKKTTTTTKKAAPKRKTATSKAKKTTRAKKPAAKKKPAKKPAAKKRVKKMVTPEAKEKATIAKLREVALVAPCNPRSLSAHNIFLSERTTGKRSESETAGTSPAVERLAKANAEWKALTPAEREHYNHLATQRTEAQRAEYTAWIKSHTPAQIEAANYARSALRRKLPPTALRAGYIYTAKLVDDRQAKRPRNAYTQFAAERQASGDFKDIKIGDRAKLLSEEWKALTDGEKKRYLDAATADKERYHREKAAQA